MSVEGYDPQTGHMDFSLALREMRKGKKVRRAPWPAEVYLCMDGGGLAYVDYGQLFSFNKARLDSEQLLANDWEEVL